MPDTGPDVGTGLGHQGHMSGFSSLLKEGRNKTTLVVGPHAHKTLGCT